MTKHTDIMIDIETLGQGGQAPIIQIGACAFSLRAGTVGVPFSILVHPDFSYTEPDPSTIAWWMKQNDAARLHVARCIEDGVHAGAALQSLSMYFAEFADYDTVNVWAMPPEFDLTILAHTARKVGQALPWKYNKTRDLRTLEYIVDCSSKDRVQATVEHDAGADAAAQASTAIKYFRMIPKPVEFSAGQGQ